jgi:DNA sulfur modification protein DndD
MMKLRRLEVEGFGPFADPQVVEFPSDPGVTVIYGENMRGKTSLLNAIRFAFFGTVVGRGSRNRRLTSVTNRDLAAEGKYGFEVMLKFEYDGTLYELLRECRPLVSTPDSDDDYAQEVLVRREGVALGPQEQARVLGQVFPAEISRFFLFDGELLQEYEELLINESEAGQKISEAIERILGVPILKRGRAHLTGLSDAADRLAAKEASRHKETEALGNALQAATTQKQAHQEELERLQEQLRGLADEKAEIERYLSGVKKYSALLEDRDAAARRLEAAKSEESDCRSDLQVAMANAWRGLFSGRVRTAREAAQADTKREIDQLVRAVRVRSASAGACEVCEQPISSELAARLVSPVAAEPEIAGSFTSAFARVEELGRFQDVDISGEVRVLSKRLRDLQLEQVTLRDKVRDLTNALSASDPDELRRSRASYSDVVGKIEAVKRGIEDAKEKIEAKDRSIQNLKRKLDDAGGIDLRASQRRSAVLSAAAEVFDAAVESYKSDLRGRVESSATELFLKMTTEQRDYAGLTINESYGLTIRHSDGRAEEARSAGAEHVVALALMGALQQNAPLRGPIVMDSPFGRLDEGHTSNVVSTLPSMAEQVVLFVYESEVGQGRMRELLGAKLRREYELQYVSSRRTNVIEVK